jgi:meso-butanediol dehydrogenase / (S,S)-butanediol dehydrogenase / diacetyl reductase
MGLRSRAALAAAAGGVAWAARDWWWRQREQGLDGQVALVTGGSRGLGLLLARELVREGCRVAICARDGEELERAADLLGHEGQRPLTVVCDVGDAGQVREMVDRVESDLGRLDVLVNNAGLGSGRPFTESSDADFTQQIELNLAGAVRCIQAALPHLVDSGGNVVSVGSVNGIAAFGDVVYSMAKAGLHNLVLNLTRDYGPRGVRFNVVAPGTIRTRVWDGREDMLRQLADTVYPLRRVGEPEDVAAAVAFLASDDAGWISGVVLPVDGGVLAGPIPSL